MPAFVHQRDNLIVVVDDDFAAFETHIWLYERNGKRTEQLIRNDKGWTREVIEEHSYERDRPPSITVPRDFVSAVAAALAGTGPPDSATREHLNDAIRVRDQMIVLVEKLVEPDRIVAVP